MRNGSEPGGSLATVSSPLHGNLADYRVKSDTYPSKTIASLSHILRTSAPPPENIFRLLENDLELTAPPCSFVLSSGPTIVEG